MADLGGAAQRAWRKVSQEWDQVRITWRGVTADRFGVQFWEGLDRSTRDYQSELARLERALDEAMRDIR